MFFKKLICFLLLLIGGATLSAQENKTQKIGLCLSGGGAKGLAHIGLLKLIDSLGIKIDYITGTSMGGVVGGLYAIGYTAKQIDSIAHSVEWELLFNQYVPMNDIYIDEKDNYGRYIAELPIKDRKIEVTGFIEGQELLNTLMRLTKHVNQIVDFNKLPIPFKCMAVDIVKVEPVVMDHGSLAIAMRATMSIPTVFKPAKVDNRLLVDGGVMVNFPVQQLKQMGADIIIGSYTGGRLLQETELNSINKLLIQTSSFYGIQKSKDEIALCNIYNNLIDSMKQYGPGDFKKANQIINTGNVVSRKILPQLIDLSNKHNAGRIPYKKPDLIPQNYQFKVDSIVIEPACTEKETRFIMNRIDFAPGDSIGFKNLEKAVRKLYATRNFVKVYYILEPQTNGNFIVKIKAEQDVKLRAKGALHYDSELGASFILNLTVRNWLRTGAVLSATIDLAEASKFRIHYKKYKRQSNSSFNAELFREKTIQTTTDANGNPTADFINLYNSFNIGRNFNLGIPSSFYIGLITEYAQFEPKYNSEFQNKIYNEQFFKYINFTSNAPDAYITYNPLTSNTTGLVGQFKYNTLKNTVFPEKGTDIFIQNKLVLVPVDLGTAVVTYRDTATGNFISVPAEVTVFYDVYDKLLVKTTQITPVSNRFSIISNLTMGFIYRHGLSYYTGEKQKQAGKGYLTSDTSSNGYKYSLSTQGGLSSNDMFFIGGAEQRSRSSFIPLMGLKEGEVKVENFASLQLGVQYEIVRNLYLTPSFTYFYSTASSAYFFKYITKASSYHNADETYWYDVRYSYGLNIGYKTLIGPISFNLSRASFYNKWRAYISIGYRF